MRPRRSHFSLNLADMVEPPRSLLPAWPVDKEPRGFVPPGGVRLGWTLAVQTLRELRNEANELSKWAEVRVGRNAAPLPFL